MQRAENNSYEFEARVRYSEIGHRGTITIPALINYFQDCSTFHSETVGLGMEHLRQEKKAWGSSARRSQWAPLRQNSKDSSETAIFI